MLSNETIKWYWNFCRYHIKAPVTFLEVGLFTILTINLKFATRFTKLIHQAQFWKTNIGYILDDLQIAVDFLLPSDVSQIDINCCLNFPTHQRIKTFQKKNYYWFFLFFCNGLNSNTLACDMMTCLWYTYSLSLDVQHLICH